jgi:simple sugar transport system substrate-binding protein
MVAAFAIAATSAATADEPLKIGYVYSGPVADVGWIKQLDLGRQYVEETLGDKTKSVVVENITEGPDVPRVVNEMIADGAKMIMLGTFGYMNDGLRIAAADPDIKFLHASGYKQLPNFSTFTVKTFEGAYVAGMAAGMATKSDTIGIVAAFPIPEVIGIANAFALGARKTNPDVTVKTVWVNTWYDPPKTANAARALASQNADVLFSLYQNEASVVSVAEELGLYSVYTTSDMRKYAPKKHLVSLDLKLGPLFARVAQSVIDGKFEGVNHWIGFADDAIEMVGWSSDLTSDQRAELDSTVEGIRTGQINPFTGPIRNQSGKEIVADGQVMTDSEIQGINWLVEGVEGDLPQ